MQVVVGAYSGKGAKELFDLLEADKSGVEELTRSVKRLVSYTLARSGDWGYSVTVCDDRAGIDESVQKAKVWIAENAAEVEAAAPKVSEGAVIVHLS